MVKPNDLRRQDVLSLARDGALIRSESDARSLPRLAHDAVTGQDAIKVPWTATFSGAKPGSSTAGPWLHLVADSAITQTCQRCLEPVEVPVAVDRWFRFAVDETTAAADDELAEEDVLAGSKEFDLLGLLEDELLMALPVVPQHVRCLEPLVPETSVVGDTDNIKRLPFAALKALVRRS